MKLQRLGKLHLSAGAFQIDDEIACDGECDVASQIFFDHGERQVDPRGDTSRRAEAAVANVDRVRLNVNVRKSARDISRESPMRRRATSVKKFCFAEKIDSDADRCDAAEVIRIRLQPRDGKTILFRVARAVAARYDDSVERAHRRAPHAPTRRHVGRA